MKEDKLGTSLNINLIASELIDLLKEKKLKVATAESCTGGLISKLITDIPGASSVFECGVCSYSNFTKEKILLVSKKTLKTHTAVSKETAMEMAAGVKKISNADIGISTTGFAGPKKKDSPEELGLVYIGLSNVTKTTFIKLNLYRGIDNDRDYIRNAAAYNALLATLNLIKEGVVK